MGYSRGAMKVAVCNVLCDWRWMKRTREDAGNAAKVVGFPLAFLCLLYSCADRRGAILVCMYGSDRTGVGTGVGAEPGMG